MLKRSLEKIFGAQKKKRKFRAQKEKKFRTLKKNFWGPKKRKFGDRVHFFFLFIYFPGPCRRPGPVKLSRLSRPLYGPVCNSYQFQPFTVVNLASWSEIRILKLLKKWAGGGSLWMKNWSGERWNFEPISSKHGRKT